MDQASSPFLLYSSLSVDRYDGDDDDDDGGVGDDDDVDFDVVLLPIRGVRFVAVDKSAMDEIIKLAYCVANVLWRAQEYLQAKAG